MDDDDDHADSDVNGAAPEDGDDWTYDPSSPLSAAAQAGYPDSPCPDYPGDPDQMTEDERTAFAPVFDYNDTTPIDPATSWAPLDPYGTFASAADPFLTSQLGPTGMAPTTYDSGPLLGSVMGLGGTAPSAQDYGLGSWQTDPSTGWWSNPPLGPYQTGNLAPADGSDFPLGASVSAPFPNAVPTSHAQLDPNGDWFNRLIGDPSGGLNSGQWAGAVDNLLGGPGPMLQPVVYSQAGDSGAPPPPDMSGPAAPAPVKSPEILPEEIAGKTRSQIRDLATHKGLVPKGDPTDPDYPRRWNDPETNRKRLRLDRGHIDSETGEPFDTPSAAEDHVHGYDANGKPIAVDGDVHIPTVGE